MHVGYLKGRVLPVAAAKFLDDVIVKMQRAFPDDIGI
jgi:hypothetical protein